MLRSRLGVRPNLPLLAPNVRISRPFRYYSGTSSTQPNAEPTTEAAPEIPAEKDENATKDEADSVPWYLRTEVKSTLLEDKPLELPPVPPAAPPHVAEFLQLLAKDYGMENLSLFDMTALADDHEFRANNSTVNYIVVGTGKSERHVFKAASEFRNHLKHTYDIIPLVEGMVSSAKTPAMRRRLLRRARKGPSATDNEYGRAANSWVLFHHEGVDVHLLTAERRADLRLETLWCAPEDVHLYEPQSESPRMSDSIFFGIRRFHTSSRALYSDSGSDVDYTARFRELKEAHLKDPSKVSFQEVEDALLQRYASRQTGDLAPHKINDVTEYAKFLLDTKEDGKEASDRALDKLSQFMSVLYRFSNDRFQMGANPHFIPVLWRLTYSDHGAVTPKMVDDAIYSGKMEIPGSNSGVNSVELSSNNARNVLTVLDHHNAISGTVPTPAFSELVLFTYGNAGKWDRFWAEWDSINYAYTVDPSVAVGRWVRLAVYLALTNHKAQNLRFLNSYWKNGSTVSGSFLGALEENGGQFNSSLEKGALVAAVEKMVSGFNNGAAFEGVKEDLLFGNKS